jgi:two-component system cell cycle sensor histidine kinase/response regulator CckA
MGISFASLAWSCSSVVDTRVPNMLSPQRQSTESEHRQVILSPGAGGALPEGDMDPKTAETLRRGEAQLRQTVKMEAVGRLAGGIAHDVNNLMTVVTGYAELLLEELHDRPRLHHMTAEMKRAADRGTLIAQQLLAFSRKQMLSPAVVSLSETVASMEPSLRRILGDDIDLTCPMPSDPCSVYVDAAQIEQVVANLAINAREAMPSGGRLTVSVAQVELNTAGSVRGPEMPQGPYVALQVADTGHGMDLETQAKIFEPFFTTKPRGQAIGFGLATVYGIVKQSGGFVYCDSAVGVGTTFTVYLPAVEASVQDASAGV